MDKPTNFTEMPIPSIRKFRCITYEKCTKEEGTARDIGKDSASDAKAKRNKIYDSVFDKLKADLTSLGIEMTDG